MLNRQSKDIPRPEFSLESLEEELGKPWAEFSKGEMVRTVREARFSLGLKTALRIPVILSFFHQTGGADEWRRRDLGKLE